MCWFFLLGSWLLSLTSDLEIVDFLVLLSTGSRGSCFTRRELVVVLLCLFLGCVLGMGLGARG